MSPGFWFAIAIIIFSLIIFIYAVVSSVYYYRISQSTILQTASNTNAATTLPITSSEANILFWVSVIVAVLALIGIGASGYMAYLLSRPVVCTPPGMLPVTAPLLPPLGCNVCRLPPPTDPRRQVIADDGAACPIRRPAITTSSLVF